MKINLLNETEEELQTHHFTWNAVKYISNAEGLIDIASFVSLAKQTYYDNSSSSPIIDPTLVVVGGSWWMSRVISATGEHWFFHRKPRRPELTSPNFSPTTARGESWITRV